MIQLTIDELDKINKRKTDANITYQGGWEEFEDEFDYLRLSPKGVRLA